MSLVAQPIRIYSRAQESIAWGFTEAESALGRRSNMGAFIAMMEGSQGSVREPDLIDDPWGALAQVQHSGKVIAARRYRIWCRGMEGAGEHAGVLARVYGAEPPHGMEAFGRMGWLAIAAAAAEKEHRRARTTKPVETWLRALSKRIEPGKDRFGRRINGHPTDSDMRVKRSIDDECENTLRIALEAWMLGARGVR